MSSEFKVIQLISSGGFYGAESVVLNLSIALGRLNCPVVIGVFQNKKHPNIDVAAIAKRSGVEVEVFDCAGRFDRRTIRAIRDCLRERQIQILHTHGYKANFYGQQAIRGGSVKQVATAHNWPGKTLPLQLYGMLDRFLLRRTDHVCAVSTNVKEKLIDAGIPSEKISLIENGVDVERFANGVPVLREITAFQGKVVVGFVGRLVWDKGLRVLMQAAREISRMHANVVFALAGEGPDKKEMELLIREWELQEKVYFLGQRTDLPDVYSSFDIFVLPSFIEGMPMVVLEAMAAGKPVVATSVGGIPEMISDQLSGLLVEPGDVEGLTNAVALLLRQPELCRNLGRRAIEVLQNRFSSEAMAKSYLSIYRKVLQPEPRQETSPAATRA